MASKFADSKAAETHVRNLFMDKGVRKAKLWIAENYEEDDRKMLTSALHRIQAQMGADRMKKMKDSPASHPKAVKGVL